MTSPIVDRRRQEPAVEIPHLRVPVAQARAGLRNLLARVWFDKDFDQLAAAEREQLSDDLTGSADC
jgi:hypothetical protein